jgi:hypothetical protein
MGNHSLQSKVMKISSITAILTSLLLAVLLEASLSISSVIAQNTTESEEDTRNQTLHIIKDATNSYTVSSGSSFIGAFDTTYSIIGNVSSMEAAKDLIISTIIEDFGNSPTIGYVNNTGTSPSASHTNLIRPLLPNPFATKNAIDEKIRSEITTSIGDVAKSGPVEGEIKCIFGTSLDDFNCSFHR